MTKYEVSGHIAHVTLNRPEKRNALSPELIASLHQSLEQAAADTSVRVIVLRGEGKDFCAGLDLGAMSGGDGVLDHLASARSLTELYLSMRKNPKPIIAAVHGRAIGGGCGLATASDMVLASASAEFRYPEVNLGFIAAIVMSMVRRIVGEKKAFEIVAVGDAIPSALAAELGLVNHVYPDADFDSHVFEFAMKLAGKSASAVALTKDLFHHIDGMSFEAAIHAGLYGNALARMTDDARQGFEKFRKP